MSWQPSVFRLKGTVYLVAAGGWLGTRRLGRTRLCKKQVLHRSLDALCSSRTMSDDQESHAWDAWEERQLWIGAQHTTNTMPWRPWEVARPLSPNPTAPMSPRCSQRNARSSDAVCPDQHCKAHTARIADHSYDINSLRSSARMPAVAQRF